MGLESRTTCEVSEGAFEGKLHLDSKHLCFSSKALRWQVAVGPGVKARADGDWLIVSRGRSKARFRIADKMDQWIDKILNPPSRAKKLGLKSELVVWLGKGFDRGFRDDLRAAGCRVTRSLAQCQMAFCKVSDRSELPELINVLEFLPAGINIWVVWPKGSERVRQAEVMDTLRDQGFGPAKTAAFDEGWSSMRFSRKKA